MAVPGLDRSLSRRSALLATGAFSLALGGLAGQARGRAAQPRAASADDPTWPRVLLFTRTTGFRHDAIPDAVRAIQAAAPTYGLSADHTEDPALFSDSGLARYAAVVFLLTTGDVLDAAQRAAFERFVRAGGGYAGVHSASDTEYGWAWYGGLVGAFFRQHPQVQPATVRIEDARHPSTAHLQDPWLRPDEWYDFRSNPRAAGVQVLATLDETTYAGGGMGTDHPIAWFQVYDGGRAWYTAGGHTVESWTDDPPLLGHVLGGIQYAASVSPLAEGATALFGAGALETLDAWERADGGQPGWRVVDGALEVVPGSGDIRSRERFGDVRLHLEFNVPPTPETNAEQDRGNSGVYLQGRYELQVLDSFGRPLAGQDDLGALYAVQDADRNAALRAGAWQTYDVWFTAARWAPDGVTRTAPARVTVRLNGVPIHDGVPLPGPTPGGLPESPDPGPLLLQEHGHPVRFRNIWAAPL